ncbi:hypothetical protein [Dehalobacterium formicoaceticum]|nr:hypothetical protein [Dehalobacterium formicoaceticum]
MGVVNINDLDRIWVKVHNRPHSRRAAIGIIEKLLLIQGDYRSLYSVWEKYSYFVEDDKEDEEDEDEDEEERMISPPIPSERSSGRGIIEQFSNMLE